MIKFIAVLLVIFTINFCSSEVLFTDEKASHPDYPEYCYYKENGHIFGKGQFYRPYGKDGGCFAYECLTPGKIGIHKCDTIVLTDHGCKRLRKDKYSPHPHCCDRYLCTDKTGEILVINPSVRADLEKIGLADQ